MIRVEDVSFELSTAVISGGFRDGRKGRPPPSAAHTTDKHGIKHQDK